MPIFHEPFWLDAVVGPEGWDVVVIESSGEILGALPFTIASIRGLTRIGQPRLSPFLGPWTRLEVRENSDYGRWHSIIRSLFESLPRHDVYAQAWHRAETNWFPLHSEAFSQSTAYTYVISGRQDADVAFSRFSQGLTKRLQIAKERFLLFAEHQETLESFFRLSRKRFSEKGLDYPYDEDELRSGFAECIEREQATVLVAKDPDGSVHGAILLVWDAETCYYLAGGFDSDFASSESSRFLLSEAIKWSLERGMDFDFEGSMIPSIEKVFRDFGGILTPYFFVEKRHRKLHKLIHSLR